MLFIREICGSKESIRVEKYLKLKNRTIRTVFTDGTKLKPELERQDYSNHARYAVITLMMILDIALTFEPSTSEVIDIVGSTTSPAYIFLFPSWLYYEYLKSHNSNSKHR